MTEQCSEMVRFPNDCELGHTIITNMIYIEMHF